jgi:hypothetical protein
VFAWDTAAAHEALETMDAAVFVVTADPPVSAAAARALARSVERRYADAAGRMRAALRAAEELRGASAAAAEEKERDLSEREVATRHALALLDEAGWR